MAGILIGIQKSKDEFKSSSDENESYSPKSVSSSWLW